MNLTTVEYEKRGHIAYVTLNRPDKLNAMNADMHRELGEVWDDFQQDDAMRRGLAQRERRVGRARQSRGRRGVPKEGGRARRTSDLS